MDIRTMQNALIEAADLVALAVCRRTTPKSDMITTRQMYQRYNRAWLDYHINRKNLVGTKAGAAKNSPMLWSVLAIEALLKAEKMHTTLK